MGDLKPPFYRDHVGLWNVGVGVAVFFRFVFDSCTGFFALCIFWIEYFAGIRQFYEKSEKVQLGR